MSTLSNSNSDFLKTKKGGKMSVENGILQITQAEEKTSARVRLQRGKISKEGKESNKKQKENVVSSLS